jgi:uncharacterized protein (TIGR03435 family)
MNNRDGWLLAQIVVVVLIGTTVILAGPRLIAQSQGAARPEVEVASIKADIGGGPGRVTVVPGRFTVENLPLRRLIFIAYKVQDFQISTVPAWVNSNRYDIVATANGLSGDRFPLMMETLLEDRFRLKVHREIREGPVYE